MRDGPVSLLFDNQIAPRFVKSPNPGGIVPAESFQAVRKREGSAINRENTKRKVCALQIWQEALRVNVPVRAGLHAGVPNPFEQSPISFDEAVSFV